MSYHLFSLSIVSTSDIPSVRRFFLCFWSETSMHVALWNQKKMAMAASAKLGNRPAATISFCTSILYMTNERRTTKCFKTVSLMFLAFEWNFWAFGCQVPLFISGIKAEERSIPDENICCEHHKQPPFVQLRESGVRQFIYSYFELEGVFKLQ